MLCKKCGKEINNNVQCSYCGCENYYERENTPEHLLYIASLLNGLQSMDYKDIRVKDVAADQRLLQAMGVTPNVNVVNDDLDEEEEMIRKKYGILINILTAVACICCLCVGFILGGVVERGQMNKENQTEAVKMAENETFKETEKESVTGTISDVLPDDADAQVKEEGTENAIVSPFRIETNTFGETYLLVDLPVGSGNYWYDFSNVFDVLNPENMISIASYEQQNLVTVDGETIKVYTLRLPLEKTEVQIGDIIGAEADSTGESNLDDMTGVGSGKDASNGKKENAGTEREQSSITNEVTIPEVNLPTGPDNNQN